MQAWKTLVQQIKFQIWISRSIDPYTNLSIEQYLLKNTPLDSRALFLYVNHPCVVIGRNQNPWLELNLGLLKRQPRASGFTADGKPKLHDVQILRRRSGGGTVFHDEGNVNWSVIFPREEMLKDRNAMEKHAAMVTRAIREVNGRARVNDRNDIVLDRGHRMPERMWPDPTDMHKTRFFSGEQGQALKISGSAYENRRRALHHGTCLLASGDLNQISQYLRSPARPFIIKYSSPDSVSSPISNVCPTPPVSQDTWNEDFQRKVMGKFKDMYGLDMANFISFDSQHYHNSSSLADCVTGCVDDRIVCIEEIKEGIEELKVR
ncbi:Biotin/lipoate A/B protein ligase [Puttea exsequens]|nr:Biotin/lipoate A/B protein ligase [Puttea exsequens]